MANFTDLYDDDDYDYGFASRMFAKAKTLATLILSTNDVPEGEVRQTARDFLKEIDQ